MNTFLRTFFICLVAALCFMGYKYIGNDSYSEDLFVTQQNPVFTTENDYRKTTFDVPQPKHLDQEETQNPIKQNKFTHTCYYYSNEGKLTPVVRETSINSNLETTIQILLKGPSIAESKKGLYTEIPGNADLISVSRNDNDIIVNLTSGFGTGGGSQSIEKRVQQLSRTIKAKEPKKNIYLHINGKEVEYLGGDGVYIKQPL